MWSIRQKPEWTTCYQGILAALYYRNFLENNLPLYLKDMPLVMQGQMWQQHDGVPLHFG